MYGCMGVCMCVCDMSLWYVFCCDLILNKILTMDLYSSQQIEHFILSINDSCARSAGNTYFKTIASTVNRN